MSVIRNWQELLAPSRQSSNLYRNKKVLHNHVDAHILWCGWQLPHSETLPQEPACGPSLLLKKAAPVSSQHFTEQGAMLCLTPSLDLLFFQPTAWWCLYHIREHTYSNTSWYILMQDLYCINTFHFVLLHVCLCVFTGQGKHKYIW